MQLIRKLELLDFELEEEEATKPGMEAAPDRLSPAIEAKARPERRLLPEHPHPRTSAPQNIRTPEHPHPRYDPTVRGSTARMSSAAHNLTAS
jgi:hypothetical protein